MVKVTHHLSWRVMDGYQGRDCQETTPKSETSNARMSSAFRLNWLSLTLFPLPRPATRLRTTSLIEADSQSSAAGAQGTYSWLHSWSFSSISRPKVELASLQLAYK